MTRLASDKKSDPSELGSGKGEGPSRCLLGLSAQQVGWGWATEHLVTLTHSAGPATPAMASLAWLAPRFLSLPESMSPGAGKDGGPVGWLLGPFLLPAPRQCQGLP